MAKKEELFPNWSVTFQMEVNEDVKAFFERTQKELDDIETATKKRIRQLFDEFVALEGKAKEGEGKLLQLFAIGYQLGWNDCHCVHEEKQ